MELVVLDMYGRKMDSYNTSREAGLNHLTIALENYRPGVYFLQFNANGETYTRKFSVVR